MRNPRVLAATILVVLVTNGLFAGQVAPSAGRDAAWLEDLDAFEREFAARQLDFVRLYPRVRFDAAMDEIRRDLSRTSDADVVLSLMRLVASGHVAHTLVRPPSSGRLAFHRLPLAVSWYGSDLAVTAAAEPYRAALGLRVARIGRLAPVDLERAVAPYIAYELDSWLRLQSGSFMMVHELLARLGQTEPDGRVRLTLARNDGTELQLDVEAGPSQNGQPLVSVADALRIPTPLFRSRPDSYYWFERLPERRALYVQYNRCANDPAKPFAGFAADLLADADAHASEIDRTIVDLRLNGGGDSRIIQPLVKGLRDHRPLRARGRLFALVGPGTFSSGLLAALDFRDLDAILIGEPPGEPLNSYGEVRPYTLPRSGLLIQYSTKFFKLSRNGAEILLPDATVARSLADALAGRDPVLEAALTPAVRR